MADDTFPTVRYHLGPTKTGGRGVKAEGGRKKEELQRETPKKQRVHGLQSLDLDLD